MGSGYLLRQHISLLTHSWITLPLSILISVALFLVHPASIELSAGFKDWMIIPFSGVTGTIIIYYISRAWVSSGKHDIISYIGRKSIWILALHLLAFKLSELLEIAVYGLPMEMLGCHTVIPAMDNWFFIIHALVAVSVPAGLAVCFDKWKAYSRPQL